MQLDVETTLNFDQLVVAGSGAGTAELRADGGHTVTGTVRALTTRTMAGRVVIRGEPGRLVRIDLPRTIEMHGLAGGSIRLESIESDLGALPRLDSNGVLAFRFGGVLHLNGNLDGEFRGDVRVSVDYF